MDFLNGYDVRFLVLAVIFWLTFGGLWRVHQQLKDAYAFGQLPEKTIQIEYAIGSFRRLSLILTVAAIIVFLTNYPFGEIFWAFGIIWLVSGLLLIAIAKWFMEGIDTK